MQAVFTDEIKAIHERIAEKIGTTQYQVWFEGATKLSMNEDHFEVAAANPFISNWIEGHFHPAIAESVHDVFGQKHTIRFRIDSSLVKPSEKQPRKAA